MTDRWISGGFGYRVRTWKGERGRQCEETPLSLFKAPTWGEL